MATLINVDGTSWSDVLEYTQEGTYHANGGSDQVLIKASNKVRVFLDRGNNQVEVTSGADHEVRITEDVAAGNQITGSDTLTICGADRVTAYLGSGKDTIDISKSDGKKADGAWSQLRGGDWGDTFKVGANATHYHLYGENGNDSFEVNGGTALSLWGGSGRDAFVVKGGTNNKLYGGDSEDTFDIYVAKQVIYLGYGGTSSTCDTVNIHAGDSQTIYGNLGINQINLLGGKGHQIKADIDRTASRKKGYTEQAINDGLGVGYGIDNVLIDGASDVTAHTGDGKDVVVVKGGTGHDIHTEGWGDTIQVEGGVTDSIFDAGTGDDRIIINNSKNNLVDCGSGKDTVTLDNCSGIEVTGVEDLTLNQVTNSKFYLGDGTAKNTYNIRINASDGNLFYGENGLHISLLNSGSNNEFHFGQGADILGLSTMHSGLDNNFIYVDKVGKDTDIINLSSRNAEEFSLATIKGGYVLTDLINNGKLYIMSKYDDPHMKVVFKNGVEQAILVEGRKSPLEVIQGLMSYYNGTEKTGKTAWDEALAYASNNYYSNFTDVYNALSNDISNATAQGWSKDQILQELYGINLNNKDTGAINGFDANDGPVKDKYSIIVQPEGMTLQDFVYDTSHTALLPDFSNKSFGGTRTNRDSYYVDIDGVRFCWNDYVIDKVANQFCSAKYETASVREAHPDLEAWVEEKKADMRQMIAGFTTTWAKGAMDQIKAAYGLSLTDPTAKENGNTFTSEGKPLVGIGFYYGGTGTTARTYINNGLYLEINLNYYQSIADVNGTRKVDKTIYNTAILENTITHELTHAVMGANIKGFTSLPFFFQEGAADLVIGDDSHRASSIRTASTDLSKYINLDNLNMSSSYSYAGGYAFLRYLAKSASEASGYIIPSTEVPSLGESLAEVDFGALQASLLDFGGNSLAVGDAALECQAMEEKASNKILAYSHC